MFLVTERKHNRRGAGLSPAAQRTTRPRHKVSLLSLLIILLPLACQPKPDINMIAHPVHPDDFMAKRLQAEVEQRRREKDQFFAKNAESPLPPELRIAFSGLSYYPIDWNYRFEGPVNRYPNQQKFSMLSTDGEWRDALKYGYVQFFLRDKQFKLQVYRLLDVEEKNLLFIPFVDSNAGKETYPAGRYIDLVEKENGLYVIDFNGAYNPSCAYGGNYACPVTPQENHLPISIPAGEKILPIARTVEGIHAAH